jgi:coenzyme F420-0:L-glutamate ligase/coenzyme F420-1:gamma-L-glutamate ligase
MAEFTVRPVGGIGEVTTDSDLVELVRLGEPRDGDIVLVTSKIVSKAEGMARDMDRVEAATSQAVRVVARRGNTMITENLLGLTMAASGVDSSNVDQGQVLLLPRDPDATARRIRESLSPNVAVIITDTAGRPWRNGQTDIAIGVAGINPLTDFAGETDHHGNPLVVTAPAVADELAGAAELATGKLGQAPISIISGLDDLVLEPNEHGPGAGDLLRPRSADMFALGTREAVLAALSGRHSDCFGTPAEADEVLAVLHDFAIRSESRGDHIVLFPDDPEAILTSRLILVAHSWQVLQEQRDSGGSNLIGAPRTHSDQGVDSIP